MPTPKKVWNPMCSCGHRAKKHSVNTRKNGSGDLFCDITNCGCGGFYPKHEPARASDWTVKK